MNHLTPHIDSRTEESIMVGESARSFFTSSDIKSIRSRLGQHPPYRVSIWQEMINMAWAGWRINTQSGGSELAFQSGILLHEELGATAAPEPLLETAILAAGVLSRSSNAEIITNVVPQLASGERS